MSNLNNTLYTGDAVSWTLEYEKDGIITYYFNKADNTFNVSATENSGIRNFAITLPDDSITAGDYTFQVVVNDNGKKKTIKTGSVSIKKSYKDGTALDEKIFEETMLEKIEEYLKNPNSISAEQTEYDGKKLSRYPILDLMKIRDKLRNTVQSHKNKVKREQGKRTNDNILKFKV